MATYVNSSNGSNAGYVDGPVTNAIRVDFSVANDTYRGDIIPKHNCGPGSNDSILGLGAPHSQPETYGMKKHFPWRSSNVANDNGQAFAMKKQFESENRGGVRIGVCLSLERRVA